MNQVIYEGLMAERGGEIAPNSYDHLRDQFESIFMSPSALASWKRKQTLTGDLSDEYMEMRVQFAWMAFQVAYRIGQKEAYATYRPEPAQPDSGEGESYANQA